MITICWVFIITDTAFLSFNRVTLSSSEAEHVCLLESRFKRQNAIEFSSISVICFAVGQTGQKAPEKTKFFVEVITNRLMRSCTSKTERKMKVCTYY